MKDKQRIVVLMGTLLLGALAIGNLPSAEGRVGGRAPEISNEIWLNSQPLRLADLRGKVRDGRVLDLWVLELPQH